MAGAMATFWLLFIALMENEYVESGYHCMATYFDFPGFTSKAARRGLSMT